MTSAQERKFAEALEAATGAGDLLSNEALANLQQKIAVQQRISMNVFEENKGQFGEGTETILFVVIGRERQFYLRRDGWTSVLSRFVPDAEQPPEPEPMPGMRGTRRPPSGTMSTHRVDFNWVDLNPGARVVSLDPSQEVRNYLNRAEGDIENVRIFATVGFENLYPGVDFEAAREGDRLTQTYRIANGSGLRSLKFAVDFSEGAEMGEDGTSLTVKTTLGDIIFEAEAEQDNRPLEVKFARLTDGGDVRPVFGFAVEGDFNKSQPLIIRLRES